MVQKPAWLILNQQNPERYRVRVPLFSKRLIAQKQSNRL
jgi:hypothetical protein